MTEPISQHDARRSRLADRRVAVAGELAEVTGRPDVVLELDGLVGVSTGLGAPRIEQ